MNQPSSKPPNWRRVILAFAERHQKTDIVSNIAVAALFNHRHGAALVAEFMGPAYTPTHVQDKVILYLRHLRHVAGNLYDSELNYKFADNVELALRDSETGQDMSILKLLRGLITRSNIRLSIWKYFGIDRDRFREFLDQQMTPPTVSVSPERATLNAGSTNNPNANAGATSNPTTVSKEEKTMSEHPGDIILDRLSNAMPGQHHVAACISELLSLQLAGLLQGPAIAPSIMLLGAPDSGQMEMVRALERIYCPEKPAAAGTDAKPATAPESNVLTIDGNNYSLDHHVAGLGGAPSEYKGSEKGGLLTNFLRKTGPKIVYIVNINCAHRNVIDLINGIVRGETVRDHNGAAFDARDAFFVFSATSIYEEANAQPTPRERDQCLHRLARKETGDVFVDAMHNVLVLKPIQGGAAFALIKAEMGRITESLGKRQITLVVSDPVLQYLDKEFRATRPNEEEEITSAQVSEFLQPLFTLPIARLMQAGEIKAGQTITPSFTKDGLVIDTPTAATPAIEAAVRQANAGSPRRKPATPPPPPPREREMGA